jgi:cellulose biosynthesis protein BcsQ
MRSIAVMNQKGGVGKTTSAVNLAAALADAGKRVCVIDLDPQAHASLHLGVSLRDGQPSIYDVLTGDAMFPDVRQQIDKNLWLLPAHLDLAAAEVELASEVGREVILRDKLVQDDMAFDFLIADCPPSLGVLTINALTMVQEVFLPLQPHFLALHGLSKLLKTIEIVSKRLNRSLRLRIPHPPQHPPRRSPQLRPIHLPIRPEQPRRGGLPPLGARSSQNASCRNSQSRNCRAPRRLAAATTRRSIIRRRRFPAWSRGLSSFPPRRLFPI